MNEHPIQGLMKTAMESIKEMIDVNTIVGDAVETPDGSVVIPISRVSLGFAAGGGEYGLNGRSENPKDDSPKMPFGGGSGAGVSVQPVAFMVVGQGQFRLLPVNQNAMIERIIDVAPQIIDKIEEIMINRKNKNLNNAAVQ
ncbi:MAG: hypothetical protein PWP21_168 [Thermosediminibacterales bacterium]|nr:hypothetical protein [Thermosediminibacterales bacterium]